MWLSVARPICTLRFRCPSITVYKRVPDCTRTARGVHVRSLYGTGAQKSLSCWKLTSRGEWTSVTGSPLWWLTVRAWPWHIEASCAREASDFQQSLKTKRVGRGRDRKKENSQWRHIRIVAPENPRPALYTGYIWSRWFLHMCTPNGGICYLHRVSIFL